MGVWECFVLCSVEDSSHNSSLHCVISLAGVEGRDGRIGRVVNSWAPHEGISGAHEALACTHVRIESSSHGVTVAPFRQHHSTASLWLGHFNFIIPEVVTFVSEIELIDTQKKPNHPKLKMKPKQI